MVALGPKPCPDAMLPDFGTPSLRLQIVSAGTHIKAERLLASSVAGLPMVPEVVAGVLSLKQYTHLPDAYRVYRKSEPIWLS